MSDYLSKHEDLQLQAGLLCRHIGQQVRKWRMNRKAMKKAAWQAVQVAHLDAHLRSDIGIAGSGCADDAAISADWVGQGPR
jgi:hypothetical protein